MSILDSFAKYEAHLKRAPATPSQDTSTKRARSGGDTGLTASHAKSRRIDDWASANTAGDGEESPQRPYLPLRSPLVGTPQPKVVEESTTLGESPSIFDTALRLARTRPKRKDDGVPSSSFDEDGRRGARYEVPAPSTPSTSRTQNRDGYLKSSPRKSGRQGRHLKNGFAERAASVIKKAQTETRLWAYDLGRMNAGDTGPKQQRSGEPLNAPLRVQVIKTWTGHKLVIARCRIETTDEDEAETRRTEPFTSQETDGTDTTLRTVQSSALEERGCTLNEASVGDSADSPHSAPRNRVLSQPGSTDPEALRQSASLQQAMAAARKYESAEERRREQHADREKLAKPSDPLQNKEDQVNGIIIFSFALQPRPPVCSEAELSACYGEIFVDIWQPWQAIAHGDQTVLLVHHFAVRGA